MRSDRSDVLSNVPLSSSKQEYYLGNEIISFGNNEQNKFIKERKKRHSINNPTYPEILDFFFLNSILQKLLLTPLYVVTILFNLAENVCCRRLDRINVQVIFTIFIVVVIIIIIHRLFLSNLLWLFFQR